MYAARVDDMRITPIDMRWTDAEEKALVDKLSGATMSHDLHDPMVMDNLCAERCILGNKEFCLL
ncbi:hypothetical protein Pfo_030043, partial [Paulownia fortunei]